MGNIVWKENVGGAKTGEVLDRSKRLCDFVTCAYKVK